MDNVRFRGKPIESLTREELIEALRQALARIRELEAAPPIEDEKGTVTTSTNTTGATWIIKARRVPSPPEKGDERHD